MKKLLCLLFVIYAITNTARSQVFISIDPDFGARGASVTTLVTASGYYFMSGSAPTAMGDFYLQKNSTVYYPSWINYIDDDHMQATWQIPANAPLGNYNVIYDPCYWMGWSCPAYVPGGFNIGDAFITGTVWHDNDSSLTQNGAENGMFNKKLLLLPDSAYSYTSAAGSYTLGTSYGNKTVKIQPGPLWNVTTDTSLTVNVNAPVMTGVNFGLKGITDIYGIDVTITGAMAPRCWWPRTYVISYTNTGTVTTHGEVKFIMPSNCTFGSAIPTYSSVLGNTYTWTYSNLLPGETRNIDVIVTLPGAGSTISPSVQANAQNPQNAIVTQDESFITQTIICSFDPNDKTVIPEGVQTPHYTLMSDTLDFVIRFQNTGTDTAFKVVIVDTLNKNILDINSFQLITYSHPVVTELKPNGKLTFTFDNILLPDSNVNEPGSHGWVRFRCLVKPGLPNNTVLNNRCFIYFDLNTPVITNTTLNTLVYQIPVGINEASNESQVSVAPNPVTSEAVFTFPENGTRHLLKIFDSTGKLIYTKETSEGRVSIPARLLKQGLLLYSVQNLSNGKVYDGKFVVM
jgi:hypothetical protein